MTSENASSNPPRKKRRWWLWIALLIVLLVALWAALNLPDLQKKANLGSAYAARVGCACRYIEGRSIESCRGDMEKEAATLVSMEDVEGEKAVTGSVTLLAYRKAEYRKDFGCILLPEGRE